MTYQSEGVDKMVDFETFTLCISLNSSQMCAYFRKEFVTGYCLYEASVLHGLVPLINMQKLHF